MLKYALFLMVPLWLAVMYYFGRAGFGRANTQQIIDKFKQNKRLWTFLDRHHGKFRASFHYIEFGACYAIIYLAINAGQLHWNAFSGLGVWVVCAVLAWLDEMHQKGSGGRCFRTVDLLHSMLGAALVMLLFSLLG